MGYSEMLRDGATPTEVRTFLSEGASTAITIRIPRNLKEATAEAAELHGMSFSAFIRSCLMRELAQVEVAR